MSDFPILNFQDFISFADGKLTTDSIKVAAVHRKRHDNVIRLIRTRVQEAGKWGALNFEESTYIDSRGKVQPFFTMTKDGYQFLVGRMTGKKAVEHQIAYIEAFTAMEAFIFNQASGIRWRLDKLELEQKDSVRRGEIHGRGLRMRQLEELSLKPAIAALKEKLQPMLPMFDAPVTVQ